MGIRVKDIASELGLSPATVSLAINNRPGVSEETRKKIFLAAEKMGYLKGLVQQNEGSIINLVIFKQEATAGLDTSFFAKMMEGIDSRVSALGHSLMITYINAEDHIEQKLSGIQSAGSLGMILLATEISEEYMQIFRKIKVPAVVLDGYFPEIPMDYVVINNVQGAFIAAEYLIENGHREIGYLTSKVRTSNFSERHAGFRKAFRKYGLEKNPDFTFYLQPSIDGACRDMEEVLKNGCPLPTAFFADNDILAAGAMKALIHAGYRVPEDISIVGFDDIPLCNLLSPMLTTVGVPTEALGRIAVDRLMDKIENQTEENLKIEVGTHLVVRKSVYKR